MLDQVWQDIVALLPIAAIFSFFGLLEILTGKFQQDQARPSDRWMEIISTIVAPGVIAPTILLIGGLITQALFPNSEGALAHLAWPVWLLLFLVGDDMTQYWWHRASHSSPFLYGLHRAHHESPYMSVRMVYRNNVFYYAMMPGLWVISALLYLGGEGVYTWYAFVKLAVIFGAHSSVKWDAPLYKIKALSPIMWVVERTISTPSTHNAHHGMHADDGVTHYKGNFGNLLFFWDVLFGTAKITRGYPERFGVENLKPVHWHRLQFWPAFPETLEPAAPVTDPEPQSLSQPPRLGETGFAGAK